MSDFLCFRNGQAAPNDYNRLDAIVANTNRLVSKVEELEDLIIELKSKQQAGDMVELKQLISELQIQDNKNQKKITLLAVQRLNSKDLFMGNDMHQSYLIIMREREKIIEKLHEKLKEVSGNRFMQVPQQIAPSPSIADIASGQMSVNN